MLVGNPSIFAIESGISKAYARTSVRALGYFNLFIEEERFGVKESEATLLAVSFDEVERRAAHRGNQVAPFSHADPNVIADAFRASVYGDVYGTAFPEMSLEDFADVIHSNCIDWAPDGDEAFDDGSCVLQFDAGNRVRLIGFKTQFEGRCDSSSVKDVWLESDEFYGVLDRWHSAFLAEWEFLPKVEG